MVRVKGKGEVLSVYPHPIHNLISEVLAGQSRAVPSDPRIPKLSCPTKMKASLSLDLEQTKRRQNLKSDLTGAGREWYQLPLLDTWHHHQAQPELQSSALLDLKTTAWLRKEGVLVNQREKTGL